LKSPIPSGTSAKGKIVAGNINCSVA